MTENKRAILVLGAESSGTRFVTDILVKAGVEGGAGHKQKWDNVYPANQKLIVWRRSVPHSGEWSFIENMVYQLRLRDYKVEAIVTTRDWYAIINSQEGKHTTNKAMAWENTKRAYKIIFQGLAVMKVPYWMFSYEGAVNRGLEYVNYFLEDIGLEKIESFQIRNANNKYYKGRNN